MPDFFLHLLELMPNEVCLMKLPIVNQDHIAQSKQGGKYH